MKPAIALLALPVSASAQTYTFSILHQFHPSPDGNMPMGQIEIDSEGNLYGTTNIGGGSGDYGTIWELPSTGEETIRKFNNQGGSYPMSGVNGSGGWRHRAPGLAANRYDWRR